MKLTLLFWEKLFVLLSCNHGKLEVSLSQKIRLLGLPTLRIVRKWKSREFPMSLHNHIPHRTRSQLATSWVTRHLGTFARILFGNTLVLAVTWTTANSTDTTNCAQRKCGAMSMSVSNILKPNHCLHHYEEARVNVKYKRFCIVKQRRRQHAVVYISN